MGLRTRWYLRRRHSGSFSTWSDTHSFVSVGSHHPVPQTYRVPFYPVVPLLFCLSSAYMFFKSLDYAYEHTFWGLAASAAMLGIGAFLAFVESYTDRG